MNFGYLVISLVHYSNDGAYQKRHITQLTKIVCAHADAKKTYAEWCNENPPLRCITRAQWISEMLDMA